MKGLRGMACVYAVVPCFFIVWWLLCARLPWLPFIVFFILALRRGFAIDWPEGDGINNKGKGYFFVTFASRLGGGKADKQQTAFKNQQHGFWLLAFACVGMSGGKASGERLFNIIALWDGFGFGAGFERQYHKTRLCYLA